MNINEKLPEIWTFIQTSPLTGLTLTLLVYCLGMTLYKKSNHNPMVNPVIISVALIIITLLLTNISYEDYFAGGKLVHFLLGPATVALAIPLYQQLHRIKKLWLPILITLLCSVVIGGVSSVSIAAWLGASLETQLSLAPKSVTTPVAMGISEYIGGITSLTAGLTVCTGILGAVIGTKIFSMMKIEDDAVKGIAMGLTSHGVGAARAFQVSPEMGAFAGLAMAISTFTTAFMLPWVLSVYGVL